MYSHDPAVLAEGARQRWPATVEQRVGHLVGLRAGPAHPRLEQAPPYPYDTRNAGLKLSSGAPRRAAQERGTLGSNYAPRA